MSDTKFNVTDEFGNAYVVTSFSTTLNRDGTITALISAILRPQMGTLPKLPKLPKQRRIVPTGVPGQFAFGGDSEVPQVIPTEKCAKCWDTGFIGGLGYPCSCGAGKGKK